MTLYNFVIVLFRYTMKTKERQCSVANYENENKYFICSIYIHSGMFLVITLRDENRLEAFRTEKCEYSALREKKEEAMK